MRRSGMAIVLGPLAVLLVVLVAPPAGAATVDVTVSDNFFDPNTSTVHVGDAVHWSRADGSIRPHTVSANNAFWDTDCNPCAGPIDVTATFSAGTFHYYCKIHGSPEGVPGEGMNGLISVPVTLGSGPAGLPFTVTWASSSSTTGSAYDVQFRVGSGKWKTWQGGTEGLKGVFGRGGKPTALHHGTRYSLRARSRTADGPSEWSPSASFKP
ncbi:MAG: hypothetical protein ABR600_06170 [Actinomycetota bacterium]